MRPLFFFLIVLSKSLSSQAIPIKLYEYDNYKLSEVYYGPGKVYNKITVPKNFKIYKPDLDSSFEIERVNDSIINFIVKRHWETKPDSISVIFEFNGVRENRKVKLTRFIFDRFFRIGFISNNDICTTQELMQNFERGCNVYLVPNSPTDINLLDYFKVQIRRFDYVIYYNNKVVTKGVDKSGGKDFKNECLNAIKANKVDRVYVTGVRGSMCWGEIRPPPFL
jgi:hypothetical protein